MPGITWVVSQYLSNLDIWQRKGCLLNNYYRSVVAFTNIAISRHIICYIIVISANNKDDVTCKNISNNDKIFEYIFDKPKKFIEQHKIWAYLKVAKREKKNYLVIRNNSHMKGLIKLGMKPSKEYILNKSSVK